MDPEIVAFGDGDIDKIAEPSVDHVQMSDYWAKVNAIVNGIDAMRKGKTSWLPLLPNEDQVNYKYRLASATMTNVYSDILGGLSSKPFSQTANIIDADKDKTTWLPLQENIDGRGNHIHVFLAEAFFRGINDAIHWILIDYPTLTEELSQAEEQSRKLQPYFVHVVGSQMLECQTVMIDGKETLSYVRIFENDSTGDRVRVFDRRSGSTLWRVYVKDDKDKWSFKNGGQITIDVIPLVPFYTGRRKGNSWQFIPAMQDVAELQVESYNDETDLKCTKKGVAFPMIAANGITPDIDPATKQPKRVPTGPYAVLFAPMDGNGNHGTWDILSADAPVLTFLATDIEKRHERMRELGRQPLTAQSGNVTRISAAFASQKSNSAVQSWALGLKDAAESALKIAAMWLKLNVEPQVFIFTQFKVETDENKVPEILTTMRKNGDLSQETYWQEMKGNNVLSSEFDPAKEKALLALEMPADPLTDDLGNPLPVVN